MKIYLSDDVFTAARKRVKWLFDEFEDVIVCVSGGKDSTVVFNLCLEEATKRKRLPLPVFFLDQEAEWQATIDYVKKVMYDKRVKPLWLQCPVKLFNATSHNKDNWLYCWKDGDKWMREKDPISIKENVYGTERFKELLGAFIRKEYSGKRTATIGGVRVEESPGRRLGLTQNATYKYITWGKKEGGKNDEHYVFYPIYDWSYTDVWKAINSNHWAYNKIYDAYYRYGVPVENMRVSNLNHETAVRSLYHLQEIEPETWNKITARIEGVDTTAKIEFKDNFKAIKKLPFMFKTWKEYRDYLLDNLITDEEQYKKFKEMFTHCDKKYFGFPDIDSLIKVEITEILANDYYFTKLKNYLTKGTPVEFLRVKRGRRINMVSNKSLNMLKEIGVIND